MKSKIAVLILTIMLCQSLFCQIGATLTYDPWNFYESMKQTYYDIQAIENQVRQLDALYQSLQIQIETIAKLPNITSLDGLFSYVDSRRQSYRNILSLADNMVLTIDNSTKKLKEVIPDNSYLYMLDGKLKNALKNGNSQEALSIKNELLAYMENCKSFASETAQKAIVLNAAVNKEIDDTSDKIAGIEKEIKNNESLTAQLQVGNGMTLELLVLMQDILRSINTTNEIAASALTNQTLIESLTAADKAESALPPGWTDEDQQSYDNMKDQTIFTSFEFFGIPTHR